ncbi:MAG: hypothetical protein JXR83_05965 [Deltaproteobacteria bacterium]|nr:hypothetical protein [Deltaproteobacteria bacterium]
MSKSRGEAIIEQRLAELDPATPRYAALEAALQFKSSWVRLGEVLSEVRETQSFRDWGYENFDHYCKDEIRITRETAAKLCRSFGYLSETQPALVVAPAAGEAPPRVPDLQAVDLLARMQKNRQVPEPVYRDLTRATFAEDLGAQELRRRLREEAPAAFARPRPTSGDSRKLLRSALSQVARLIETLQAVEQLDDTILEQAEALRSMIAGRLEEIG